MEQQPQKKGGGEPSANGASLEGRSYGTRVELQSALLKNGFRIIASESDMNSKGVTYSGAYWIAKDDNPDEDFMVDVKIGQNHEYIIDRIRKT